jgi:hypothetical protein
MNIGMREEPGTFKVEILLQFFKKFLCEIDDGAFIWAWSSMRNRVFNTRLVDQHFSGKGFMTLAKSIEFKIALPDKT